MSGEEEIRRLLDELVRLYGRATVIRFLEWWLSRKVAAMLPRSRGYDGRRSRMEHQPHAPALRASERNQGKWLTPD